MGRYRLTLLLFILLPLTACNSDNELSGHDHPNLKTGKQLFNFHCSSCHSKDGHGQFLKGIPSNRTTELSIQQIIIRIRTKSTDKKQKMPTFPSMGSSEARKIATHLLKLKKEYSTRAQ